MKTVIVTGGLGFIGSRLALALLSEGLRVVVVDCKTYAADLRNLENQDANADLALHLRNITEDGLWPTLLSIYEPDCIYHLAAESHVDRSIIDPSVFFESNVRGSVAILNAVLDSGQRPRIVYMSTDEVYGSLAEGDAPFTEANTFKPSSAYSASKAAADGYMQAYARTYGLDIVIARPTNNYGPAQHPEKLIPKAIAYATEGVVFPLHADGSALRDWLHVDDCVRALQIIADRGVKGEAYGISSVEPRTNRQVLDRLKELTGTLRYASVPDRYGSDWRYATNPAKMRSLGWEPTVKFDDALSDVIEWYRSNPWRLLHAISPTQAAA